VTVLLTSFLYCLLAAVVVVLPAEAYLVGAALAWDVAPGWLALSGAAGQVAGKMLFYLVGRGVLDVARVRRRGTAGGRWAERMTAVEAWCRAHAWGPSAVTAVSAFAGVPPYAVVSVLAGTVGMRWWLFALVSLAGRFLRFWALVLAPELLPGELAGG
jgi:membrane protein YqaA with SNARE-associated domain